MRSIAVVVSAAAEAPSGRGMRADFNGDGYADLAIGVPHEDFTSFDEGGVNVLYGSASGLSATATRPDQFWSQDSRYVQDQAEGYDYLEQVSRLRAGIPPVEGRIGSQRTWPSPKGIGLASRPPGPV
ncbi:hypothetical protein BH20ACT24_BH20ACT24_10310 [soil metagenome]